VSVTGVAFVGIVIDTPTGVYPSPIDAGLGSLFGGESWI